MVYASYLFCGVATSLESFAEFSEVTDFFRVRSEGWRYAKGEDSSSLDRCGFAADILRT